MRKIYTLLSSALLLMLVPGAASAQTGSDGGRRMGSGYDEWTVDCSPPGKGLPEECYASVHYYPGPNESNGPESPARVVYMFSVSAAGVKFHEVRSTNDTCAEKPVKRAVDDKPIHSLSVEKQIEAVLKGRVYSFDYLDLPCTLVTKFVTISGASPAYDRMMTRWKNREFLSGRETLDRRP